MKLSMNHALVLTLSSLTILLPRARASEWDECWNGTKIRWAGTTMTLSAAQSSFLAGDYWHEGLLKAKDAWNKSPSKFRYAVTTGDKSIALGNGQSEIWWSGDIDQDVLALCFAYSNSWTCLYTETDILINTQYNFTASEAKSQLFGYGGEKGDTKDNVYSFQATVIHEMGHAQGLMHESDNYNVMGDGERHMHANGSTARCYAGEDSIAASMAVYGKHTQTIEDVAVTHWRYAGISEFEQWTYSTHDRTRIFRNGKECHDSSSEGAEPRYDVKMGWVIDLELTYENLGKSTQKPKVKYYLSSNDTISKSDTYLGSKSLTLSVNQVVTSKATLTIPTGLVVGKTYWLGAVVDADGAIPEIDEWNNATYVAIRIL